ncbi:hypothetical protein BDY19DRAFT_559999 [Irpex rosettiformis]|uniref:Uncharacterized protein n=1 Tax=Irpex rosettiformis TaxID=378272 RepID=A0ACB8TPQ5_9APHY|nr:hypothetical protein BDY19DRAFT_559999 [Irpex rosettiformis]
MKPLSALFVICFATSVLSRPQQEVLATPKSSNLDELIIGNSSFGPPGGETWTFPFAQTMPAFTVPSTFVTNLYQGGTERRPWLNNTQTREPDVHPWMIKRIGNADLTPDTRAGEYVGNTANPNWRWAEMWRVLVVYKTLLATAAAKPNGNGLAVTEYINSIGTDALSTALFPQAIRTLLKNNEQAIVNVKKPLPWVGNPQSKAPYSPFSGVRVTSANDARFKQDCPVGPLSIEASFILATQLAGINWKTLNAQLTDDVKHAGVYWINAIIPYDNKDNVIEELRGPPYQKRNLGYLSRRGDPVTGSPDGGFSLVLDIDPSINGFKQPKNLFTFAVHIMNPHSRMFFQYPERFRAMTYKTSYEYKDWKKNVEEIEKKNRGENVRFYAHAHGGVMPFKTYMGWLGQKIPKKGKGDKMPNYEQIGKMHLYFLPEDENAVWPRSTYLTNDRSNENPYWSEPDK